VLAVILPGIVPGYAKDMIGGMDIHFGVLRSPGLMQHAELAEITDRHIMGLLRRRHSMSGLRSLLATSRLIMGSGDCSLHSELRISRMGRKT
jgi:hypothetical protein